jgi:hypothetical protein
MSRERFGALALAAAAALALAGPLHAQWYRGIRLQETLDAQQQPQPALGNVIFRGAARPAYVVGAGVQVDMPFGDQWTAQPGLELQRNTFAPKPTDVFKAGAKLQYKPWDLADTARGALMPVPKGQVNYKRNGIDTTNSLQISINLSLLGRGQGGHLSGIPRPGPVYRLGDALAFDWMPSVGGEFESNAKGTAGAISVGRLVVAVHLETFPAQHLLNYHLQLTGDYAYRRGTQAEDGRRTHHWAQLSLNLVLLGDLHDSKHALAIGVDYVGGGDPAQGLKQQEFVRLGLKAQL